MAKVCPCGCAVDKHYGIHYCPKHKAAPDMYEALKELLWIAEATHGAQDRVLQAKQALSKAEGRKVLE